MDTGGLAYKLALKLNAKVMITTNINVEDKLCNGQIYDMTETEMSKNYIYKWKNLKWV